MQIESVPITDLVLDPENVRTHDGKNLDAIKKSLARFGQQKPIVVNGSGEVVAGNGTLTAAKDLGCKTINIVKTELLGTEATAYAVADNRTGELAGWDEAGLQETLGKLKEEGFDLKDLGWDEAELDNIANEIEKPKPSVEFSEYIDEANNYVVLLFKNEIDWLSALTHFEIKTKTSRRQNGKPWSSGVGRVIDGASYIQKMAQADVDGTNG